jgi:hypothetical protein
MRLLIGIIAAASVVPALAQEPGSIGDFGARLAMLKYAPEMCGTSLLDQQIVEDAIYRIAAKIHYDRATLRAIANGYFTEEQKQTIRTNPEQVREYMELTYCPKLRKLVAMSKEILIEE